jgi:pimeloyl-ACP methyl ester carboxylesterase
MALAPHWLQINDQIINLYAVSGSEPAVILLHGGGWWPVLADTPLLSWGPTLEVLSKRRRAIAVDWPTCETEDAEVAGPLPGQAAGIASKLLVCLDDILNALGLDTVVLVGLSMGGCVAMDYALRNPKRVEKLVLVSSYGLHSHLPLHKLMYLYLNLPLVDEFMWNLMRSMRWTVRPSLRYILRNYRIITPALMETAWQLTSKHAGGNTFFHWLKSEVTWRGMRTSYLNRLSELEMPVLLVHGEKDRLVPVDCARQAQRLIPQAELLVFPNCGHWPQREYAPAFHQALIEFVGIE